MRRVVGGLGVAWAAVLHWWTGHWPPADDPDLAAAHRRADALGPDLAEQRRRLRALEYELRVYRRDTARPAREEGHRAR